MPEPLPPRTVLAAALGARQALLALADLLIPAHFALFERTRGIAVTQVIGTIAELGVPDALTQGPATSSELASRLEVDADALHRVLRAGAVFRVVRLRRDGRFALTRQGRALRSDAPNSVSPWARYMVLESTVRAWSALTDAVRTGTNGFRAAHGTTVWDWFGAHPEEERLFAEAMRRLTGFDAPAIVAAYPWPEHGTVCDVAGGVGTLLAAVLERRTGLRGVLVDAPGVLAEAEGFLAARGVRDRVELVEGNMFERVDARADLYLLKDVLHDWGDDACRQILRTVRGTMPPGASVVLIERLQEHDRPRPVASFVDVQMLSQCDGGRQRSPQELAALLRDAGLESRPPRLARSPDLALLEGVASELGAVGSAS